MDGIFPGAHYRPVRFAGKTGAFPHDPLGWILHVQDGNGSPWHLFDASKIGKRKVSTGWVAKDGSAEQYISAYDKPWAQAGGNAFYWAWETEGFPTEPLTVEQIKTLAAIHNWHGTADNVVDNVGGRGIGTHEMGGSAWGGHACPGRIRAAQRKAIISIAQTFRKESRLPISDADAAKIADVVAVRYQVHNPLGGLNTRDSAIGAIWSIVLDLQESVSALRAEVTALKGEGGNGA